MQPIDVILTNHKRADNLPRIIESIRSQTVSTRITLIDNPAKGVRNVNTRCIDCVDRYIQIQQHPYTASIRVLFAQTALSDWVLILDDDLSLFNDFLAHLLSKRQDGIGMIGYIGRNFVQTTDSGWKMSCVSNESKDRDRTCDLIVRCYLCRTQIFSKLGEATRYL